MLQFEDVKEYGIFYFGHHEIMLRRFMKKGLTLEEIMTKPVPKSYTTDFKGIGFRMKLLWAYSEKDDKFKKDLEKVMYEFICSSLDKENYCIEEAKKLKAYFIGENKKDQYTYFPRIGRKLNRGGSSMWEHYQAIASYNWFVREGLAFTSFVNYLYDKTGFIKAVYDKFGYTAPEMRITHIY